MNLPYFVNRRSRKVHLELRLLAERPSLRLKADLRKLGINWRKVVVQ